MVTQTIVVAWEDRETTMAELKGSPCLIPYPGGERRKVEDHVCTKVECVRELNDDGKRQALLKVTYEKVADTYDIENAQATAWDAAVQVFHYLSKAIAGRRAFRVMVSGDTIKEPPVRDEKGQLWEQGHSSGRVTITITTDPPARCPKCGKDHREEARNR